MNNVNLSITFDALAIERAGAPVSFQQKTIDALNAGEALIRVAYASINKMDPLLAHRNIFNLPEPYVLGFDFSGEIVALGAEGDAGLESLTVGQQVLAALFGAAPLANMSLPKERTFCRAGKCRRRKRARSALPI